MPYEAGASYIWMLYLRVCARRRVKPLACCMELLLLVLLSLSQTHNPRTSVTEHHVDCVHLSLSGAIALLGGRCSSSDVVYMKVTSALEDSDHRRFTFEHAVHFLGTRALCSLAHLAIARVCLTNGFQSALICTYQDDLLEGEFPK